MGNGYLRPGYSVPSPYNIPTPIRMSVDGTVTLDATAPAKYVPPPPRPWITAGAPVVDHQELQRLKSLRVAAQKEAIMTNVWRLQKVKEHAAGESLAEDEAFDRYMSNCVLLEEVFGLNGGGGLQGIEPDAQLLVKDGEEGVKGAKAQNGGDKPPLDAMKARLAADPKRKEARRQKLKQVIDRAFKRLRNTDQESEQAEDEDTLQAGILGAGAAEKRWEPKKFKARTEEGKQVLKTIEAFDTLMQKLSHIKSPEGIQSCMDQYKMSLGANLHYLVPNLYPRDDPNVCSTGNSTGKVFDNSLISPRATLLNYLSGAFLEANPEGQVVINNRNDSLPGGRHLHKHKERAWENGVEKLERLHWHRKYMRGMGWWKVYAHDDTIHKMCFERANANTTILEL